MPVFRRLARGLRRDYQAVRMALATPWSTGQCEGQICRVKFIKWVGYGALTPTSNANECFTDLLHSSQPATFTTDKRFALS